MAVYTHLNETEVSKFLEAYHIGDLKSLTGIEGGVENTNYRLVTTEGRFILTLFEKRTKVEDLPFFIGLMRHLAQKHVAVPHPLACRNGDMIKKLHQKPIVLFSELPGESLSATTSQHCAAIGTALATLHVAASDFEGQRDNALSVSGWKNLLAEISKSDDAFYSGISRELEGELEFLEHHWPRHLPKGVVHADLFPDNVLWTHEQPTGLLDFYFSCRDLLAYDVAVCLNAWCFTGDQYKFDLQKAKALLAAYEAVRPLNAAEKQALPILCRGAAFRFLMTRLYDKIHTPKNAVVKPHDPQEYLQKNRAFRNAPEILAA